MQHYRPFTVHITPKRGGVRKHVCRCRTTEHAIRVAEKLLKGAKGSMVEVFEERFDTDAELVSVLYQKAS